MSRENGNINAPSQPSAGKSKEQGQIDNVIIRAYALKYYKQVSQLLNVLPSDMILLFKTNDCLRHIDSLLYSPINTMKGKNMFGSISCIPVYI